MSRDWDHEKLDALLVQLQEELLTMIEAEAAIDTVEQHHGTLGYAYTRLQECQTGKAPNPRDRGWIRTRGGDVLWKKKRKLAAGRAHVGLVLFMYAMAVIILAVVLSHSLDSIEKAYLAWIAR